MDVVKIIIEPSYFFNKSQFNKIIRIINENSGKNIEFFIPKFIFEKISHFDEKFWKFYRISKKKTKKIFFDNLEVLKKLVNNGKLKLIDFEYENKTDFFSEYLLGILNKALDLGYLILTKLKKIQNSLSDVVFKNVKDFFTCMSSNFSVSDFIKNLFDFLTNLIKEKGLDLILGKFKYLLDFFKEYYLEDFNRCLIESNLVFALYL